MIEGRVSAKREAIIPITVQGSNGETEVIDAIVDTGFNDYLTLLHSTALKLNLLPAAPLKALLADGSEVSVNLYYASVIWDGVSRSIVVVASEGKPLLGMSMLYGYDLFVRALDGGIVTVTRTVAG